MPKSRQRKPKKRKKKIRVLPNYILEETPITTWQKIKGYLFLTPFYLIGLFLISWTLLNFYKITIAKHWIPVTAQLEEVTYKSTKNSRGKSTATVEILYTYEYEGKAYTSDILGFGYSKSNAEQHLTIYSQLKNAKAVKAYLNPSNPTEATLIQGFTNDFINLSIFMLLWNTPIFLYTLSKIRPNTGDDNWKIIYWIWGLGAVKFLFFAQTIDVVSKIVVLRY